MAEMLATLAQVKEWAGVDPTNSASDGLLSRMINSASQFILNYCTIDSFGQVQYDETYDGYGKDWMVLRQSPAIAVLALSSLGSPIPAATGNGKTTPFSNGYVLQGQRITLYSRCFPPSRGSVFVSYTAGYVKTESWTVPDLGGAVALTQVTGTPDDGEFALTNGAIVFNPGQGTETAVITYGYAPADIVQATIEMVAERYKYKDRIGYSSKALGGQETISFQANKTPQFVLDLLNKYKNTALY